MEQFKTPIDEREAEERRIELLADIETIQNQLKANNQRDETGRPLTYEEHARWRHRAQKALTIKKAEYSHVKLWLREHRIDRDRDLGVEPFIEQLKHVMDLLRSMQKRIEEKDQQIAFLTEKVRQGRAA